jgi:hypothetical protein
LKLLRQVHSRAGELGSAVWFPGAGANRFSDGASGFANDQLGIHDDLFAKTFGTVELIEHALRGDAPDLGHGLANCRKPRVHLQEKFWFYRPLDSFFETGFLFIFSLLSAGGAALAPREAISFSWAGGFGLAERLQIVRFANCEFSERYPSKACCFGMP